MVEQERVPRRLPPPQPLLTRSAMFLLPAQEAIIQLLEQVEVERHEKENTNGWMCFEFGG